MQIYKITNTFNNRIYVGKDKRNNPKYYGSGILIKLAISKYGLERFKKEIIEECTSDNHMSEREKFWIKELKSHISHGGYNLTWGGEGGDTTSFNPNRKDIIEKRRIKNTGKKRSAEFCESMRRIQINLNVSREVRLNRRKKGVETYKNRIEQFGFTEKELKSQEDNAKRLSDFSKSEEGRKIISDSLKGKSKPPFTEEHRKNIGKSSKGRICSSRRKITVNGVTYNHMHEASNLLSVPLSTIQYRLRSDNFSEWNYS